MEHLQRKKNLQVFLLLLITVGQFGVDIFLPSLPHIADHLSSSISSVKLTVPLYLVGLGISQLFFGPISDCTGRKKTLLTGLGIYTFGSIGCFFANSIELLIFARLVQGLGGGAIIVRTIMRDVFHGKELVRISALSVIVWSITPIVAPLIGGYIQTYFGWRANFAAMFFYSGLILSLAIYLFPETLDLKQRKVLKITSVIKQYKEILSSKLFLALSLMTSLCYGFFISFATASPFLFQSQLNLSPIEYGWTLLFIAIGTAFGSALCRKAVMYYRVVQIILVGILCMLCATLIMTSLALCNIFTVYSLLLPPFIGSIGSGLIFPNCAAKAMGPHKSNAGAAGASIGFIQMFSSFIFTVIVSSIPTKTALPLAIVLLVISLLLFSIFFFYARFCFEEELVDRFKSSSI
ncbi:MAG: multidrug effflux MFS transporter [Chlamydiales bacterium]